MINCPLKNRSFILFCLHSEEKNACKITSYSTSRLIWGLKLLFSNFVHFSPNKHKAWYLINKVKKSKLYLLANKPKNLTYISFFSSHNSKRFPSIHLFRTVDIFGSLEYISAPKFDAKLQTLLLWNALMHKKLPKICHRS